MIYPRGIPTHKALDLTEKTWICGFHRIVGVTGFEAITPPQNTAGKGVCIANNPQVTHRSRYIIEISHILQKVKKNLAYTNRQAASRGFRRHFSYSVDSGKKVKKFFSHMSVTGMNNRI